MEIIATTIPDIEVSEPILVLPNGEERYVRKCPECGEDLEYKRKGDLNRSISSNSKHRGCAISSRFRSQAGFDGYKIMDGIYFGKFVERAKKDGRGIDVTREFLYNLWLKQDKKCALSGLPIELAKEGRNISLDRIDPSGGYTMDNVQWVTLEINRMKWDLPQDRFIEMCRTIIKNQYKK